MTDKQKDRSGWIRWSGIGFEFFGVVVGCTLAGYGIDYWYGCKPWGVGIGAALGLVVGMYNLIRESLVATREADERYTENRKKKEP